MIASDTRELRIAPGAVITTRGGDVLALTTSSVLEVAAGTPREAEALAAALANGGPAHAVDSDWDDREPDVDELRRRLAGHGVLARPKEPTDDDGSPDGLPRTLPLLDALIDPAAIATAQRLDDHGPVVIATAEELLVVPPGLGTEQVDRLMRDFLAGLGPPSRRGAYSRCLATGRRAIWGDLPASGEIVAALPLLARVPAGQVGICDLRRHRIEMLDRQRIGGVGAGRAHRLGTVVRVREHAPDLFARFGLRVVGAEHAHPAPLTPPGPLDEGPLLAKGVAPTRRRAALIARAEAAERHAIGIERTPRLAARAELERAIGPEELYAPSARQRDAKRGASSPDGGTASAWLAGRGASGEEVWAPAVAVSRVPARPEEDGGAMPSSSGVAAGRSLADARERALRELVERDAFMWTWVQGLSRERIAPASLPDEIRACARILAAGGIAISFVNLTLETVPVLLCGLRSERDLVIGAAAHLDAATAGLSAFRGALAIRVAARLPAAPAPGDVRVPEDHAALYREADHVSRADFLFASHDEIELADVRGAEAPLAEALQSIGPPVGSPVSFDLTTPAARPFRVVRALVPGLVPITFGYDSEPLGMELLARPRRDSRGRLLGARLELDRVEPLFPHPFA